MYDTTLALVSDQVDVRLFGGDDRIRLPRAMMPLIHGGADGWFKLKNVVADARTIRATAPLNFYSSLKVYIDRTDRSDLDFRRDRRLFRPVRSGAGGRAGEVLN